MAMNSRFVYLVDRLQRANVRFSDATNDDERRIAGRWLAIRNRSVQLEFARIKCAAMEAARPTTR